MSRKAFAAALVCLGATFCATTAPQDSRSDNGKGSAQFLLEVAQRGLVLVEKPSPGARDPYFGVFTWSKRVLEAELHVSATTDERIAARQKYLERMIKLEHTAKYLFAHDAISYLEFLENQHHRAEAQVQLNLERGERTSRRGDEVSRALVSKP